MKRDLIWYGKVLLVVLAPGGIALLFFLFGAGPVENGRWWGIYLALAGFLLLLGTTYIVLRYFVKKIAAWIGWLIESKRTDL
jgi:hypothetical protein